MSNGHWRQEQAYIFDSLIMPVFTDPTEDLSLVVISGDFFVCSM